MMASASTPSANEPAKDINFDNTVQLKPIIKAHFSGSVSDVAFASVHSEKTNQKNLIMILIIIKKSQERQFLAGARN